MESQESTLPINLNGALLVPSGAAHRFSLAAIGLIQGVIFWRVYASWPSTVYLHAYLVSLIVFSIAFGAVFQFSWTRHNFLRLVLISGVFATLFSLVALWVWEQVPIPDQYELEGENFRRFTFIVGGLISIYIMIPFIQIFQANGRYHFPYTELFHHSWNNCFIAVLAGFFCGVYWLLIQLWAGLFNILGIAFFKDIFNTSSFSFITIATVFGFGLALGKENGTIINTLRRILLSLFRMLLPLLSLISLFFLVTLPFTGLHPLWSTRMASPLLLTVQILTILFINAVFQDGNGNLPYPKWLIKIVEGSLVFLPLFAGLTLYSIYLRISQYGLMPDRFYVVLIALIAGLYGCGYMTAVFVRSSMWMGMMRPVNLIMSLLVVSIALLIHTPVLDPISWSADDQYNRLVQGKIDPKTFDYGALKFKLGKPGNEKLDNLSKLDHHSHMDIIQREIQKVRQAASYYQVTPKLKILKMESLEVLNPSNKLPEGLFETLASDLPTYEVSRCEKTSPCGVARVTSDVDSKEIYMFIPPGGIYSVYLYSLNDKHSWYRVGEYNIRNCNGDPALPSRPELFGAIKQKETNLIPSITKDLKIGKWEFLPRNCN